MRPSLTRNRSIVCIVILFLSLACMGQGRTFQTRADVFSEIEKLALEGIKKHNFPSIAVGIVLRGKTIYAKGFGYADRETKTPATKDTVYQIGSVTKTFTGNILAQLIVEKKISLNDPLMWFFPTTLKFPTDKNGKTITVKDLATHSAGFPRYPANLNRTDGEPIRGFSREQLIRGIELVSVGTAAGESYSYSNFGYGVLGVALENRTGRTLSQLLSERIFRPVGMKSSSLVINDRIRKELAVPYRDDNPTIITEPWDMGSMSGAGNVFTSVSDLSLFMIEMLKETAVNGIQQTDYLKINETWSYGLGCFVIRSKAKNTTMIHHGGDIDGYASYIILYPERKAGLVILTNSGMGQPFGEIAEGIHELAYNELFRQRL